jgi:hypothetical protein
VARLSCKDCPPGSKRPAPHPGPRCATHHRERRRTTRKAAHGRRLEQVYGITAEDYEALLFVQGGVCAICQRARGVYKRLSVDHDHNQARLDGHDEDKGCRNCVRGLLCGTCNKMLGHLRDDPTAFERASQYLSNWPSRSAPTAKAAAEKSPTGATGPAPGAGASE